jgi:hypothetical protein
MKCSLCGSPACIVTPAGKFCEECVPAGAMGAFADDVIERVDDGEGLEAEEAEMRFWAAFTEEGRYQRLFAARWGS